MDSIKSIVDNNKKLFLSLSNFIPSESKSFIIDTEFCDKVLVINWQFFKKDLSRIMEIGAVKEEVSGCFNLPTTTTNEF